MSVGDLREMGIDPERVGAAIDFLQAYATLCESELADRSSAGSDESAWTTATDGASAFREAAQWAVAVGDERAPQLLVRAARLFAATGQAYGLFLGSACRAWGLSETPMPTEEHVRQLASVTGLQGADVQIPSALHHPQQQAYAFLAAAGSSKIARDEQPTLVRIGRESGLHEGTAPVGALGAPVREYWNVALALLEGEMTTVSRFLGALGSRYAASIDLARTNGYLWSNAAAPVDVADADILATTLLAIDRFGAADVSDTLTTEMTNIPWLAQVPIRIALDAVDLGFGEVPG